MSHRGFIRFLHAISLFNDKPICSTFFSKARVKRISMEILWFSKTGSTNTNATERMKIASNGDINMRYTNSTTTVTGTTTNINTTNTKIDTLNYTMILVGAELVISPKNGLMPSNMVNCSYTPYSEYAFKDATKDTWRLQADYKDGGIAGV
jgi:coproporphyrinogen III oxidase